MTRDDERDALIEAAVTAFRERDLSGRVLPSPAWMDLLPDDREEAYESQAVSRRLEAALDERGMNTTVHVVAAKAERMGQLG